MTQQELVYEALDKLGIEYKVIHHQAVNTIEEMDATGLFTDGEVCKNLFLRNANGKTHYVVSMLKDKHPDIQKDIRAQLGCSRLSFGSDERLMKHLGLQPGAVSPLALSMTMMQMLMLCWIVNLKPLKVTSVFIQTTTQPLYGLNSATLLSL